jgi:hypothetical protein
VFRPLVAAIAVSCAIGSVGAFVVGATHWTSAAAVTNCTSASPGWSAAELDLLRMTNDLRQRNGVAPLAQSDTMANAAAWMAEDMSAHGGIANPPTHDDWSGRTFFERASDCGGASGENVAWGYPSAAAAFQGWVNSPGHLANLLNPSFKSVGFGNVGVYWVADFSVAMGAAPPPPTPSPVSSNGGSGNSGSSGGGSGSGTTGSSGSVSDGSSGSAPGAIPTVLPAKPYTQQELPSNVPIRRAMVQMVASE